MAAKKFDVYPISKDGAAGHNRADAAPGEKLSEEDRLRFELNFLKVALKFCVNQSSLATSFARNITQGDTERLIENMEASIEAIASELPEDEKITDDPYEEA